ncbi:hypothetical protein [Streptomyces goshikiensis]|uniref:hypothetical protein n=1 Tax=Streptomyces goshikiensis TaxID=1942 RepID=UPI003661DB84
MSQLTHPRSAKDLATRARMALAAYRAVPGREATHELDRCLNDMWGYSYFALQNGDDIPLWTSLSKELFDAEQLLKPATADQPAQAARAAADAIHRFEQVTGITPGSAPEPIYTRTEAEQAAHAAFERLRLYIKLEHDNDRRFVTEAFLAFLDNPNSRYPYESHDPDDEEDGSDKRPEPEPSPEGAGERENSLLSRLGPRTDTVPHLQADNQ